MKVLIIEDQEIKKNEIRTLIAEIFSGACEISCIEDYRPALASITYMSWDLIVLDMSFEASKGTDDESSFQSLAGLQVLQHMRRRNISIPVIIVTSHTQFNDQESLSFESINDLDKHIKIAFSPFYKGTVLYKPKSSAWTHQVREIINNVFN